MLIKNTEIMVLLEIVQEVQRKVLENKLGYLNEGLVRESVLNLSNKKNEVFEKLETNLSQKLASSIFLNINLFDITDLDFCRGMICAYEWVLLMLDTKGEHLNLNDNKMKDIYKIIEEVYAITNKYELLTGIGELKAIETVEDFIEEKSKTFLPTITNLFDKTFYKTFIYNADVNCLSGIRYFIGTLIGASHFATYIAYGKKEDNNNGE